MSAGRVEKKKISLPLSHCLPTPQALAFSVSARRTEAAMTSTHAAADLGKGEVAPARSLPPAPVSPGLSRC